MYDKFNEKLEHDGGIGMMKDIMDPVKNKFILTTWKNFEHLSREEVWLSAPCVLMDVDKFINLTGLKS